MLLFAGVGKHCLNVVKMVAELVAEAWNDRILKLTGSPGRAVKMAGLPKKSVLKA